MEQSGKTAVIIAIVTVVGGIVTTIITTRNNKGEGLDATESVVHEASEPAPPMVETGGLYISNHREQGATDADDDDLTNFFRFFSDYTVANEAVLVNDNDEEVENDLTALLENPDGVLNKHATYTGKYGYADDGKLQFTITNGNYTYHYVGEMSTPGIIKTTRTGQDGDVEIERLTFKPFP